MKYKKMKCSLSDA